jgi:toxin ParE1/3/4
MKSVILRHTAERDVQVAFSSYFEQAGADVSHAFVAALDRAFAHIGAFPATGSLRYGEWIDLPHVRFWPLKDFPYGIFFLEKADHVDVVRVLHLHTDIPAHFSRDEG